MAILLAFIGILPKEAIILIFPISIVILFTKVVVTRNENKLRRHCYNRFWNNIYYWIYFVHTHLSTLYFPLKLLKYSFIEIIATIDIDIFTTVVFPSISIIARIATNIKPDKIRLIFIIFSPHLGVRQIFYFFFDILLLLLLNLLYQTLANVYLENKILNM